MSHAIIARVAPHAAAVERKLGRRAALAIVAGADAASRRFVQIKQRLLTDVPIRIEPIWLSSDATTIDVIDIVTGLNLRADLEAIFLQFPLPAHIDAQAVADAIDASKDIDCSGTIAEAQFNEGTTRFIPVAPQAAVTLLKDALGSIPGRRIVICGVEDAFTRALRTLLQRADAVVAVVEPDDARLGGMLRDADALVAGESVPASEALSHVAALAAVLDAGYYLPPRRGEWVPSDVRDRVGIFMRQYGNVGPLTVAHLARATVRAASRRIKLDNKSGLGARKGRRNETMGAGRGGGTATDSNGV